MALGVDKPDMGTSEEHQKLQLYKAREPVYPKLGHGKYRYIKWIILFATLGVYYLLPWVRWPRGAGEPSQAVLVDFAHGRFYFFFIEIWPDELYFLTGLLVLSALVLFLVTALFGRLWCGYSCPQTVWTDLFIAVERLVEGDRNQRMKLAKQPWSFGKVTKKVTKHAIWLLIAAMTGGAWVLYFHDAPTVMKNLFTGHAPASSYLFIAILTFTTYSLAGIMREQVCTYMCPWPRIQAAMTDAETINVGYFAARGEPRGKHRKGPDADKLGDCIDCSLCVQVCPMGIDIRDGDQLECINCGLCIDACDEVMVKVHKPKGLIAYASNYRTATKDEKPKTWPHWIRARTIFYGGVVAVIAGLIVFGMSTTSNVEFNIERNRAPAFTTLSDGHVRNAITARILNKNNETHEFSIHFEGPESLEISAVGLRLEGNTVFVPVPGDKLVQSRIFMTLPKEDVTTINGAPSDISVILTDTVTGETLKKDLKFVSKG
ncbi:MAG: cytochrome c oxidase accessory protein CcoG [Parvularcula sp.]